MQCLIYVTHKNSKTMIEIQNVDFAYRKRSPIFRGINLQLDDGHIHGLLGKNGAGKTTLLRLMSGLLFPKSGTITALNQTPMQRCPEFLKEMFFLPEELYFPNMDICRYGKLLGEFYPHFNGDMYEQFLRDFEIKDLNQSIADLSHGNKKKVMISFGLAANTKLLFMDEPTNGLDIPSKSQFRKMVSAIASEDRCIIISTHQVRDLHALIDNIVILDEHEILLNKSTEEITRKLVFRISDACGSHPDALYCEDSIKGTALVEENTLQEESKLDIELLFNAVFADKTKIKQLFQ